MTTTSSLSRQLAAVDCSCLEAIARGGTLVQVKVKCFFLKRNTIFYFNSYG